MSSPISLLNMHDFQPFLKPGHRIVVHPTDVFGVYEVDRSAQIEFLPPVIFNIATPFTTSVAAAGRTAQTPTKVTDISALDMPPGKLAQYRIAAMDNLLFRIFQPSAIGRFANNDNAIQFDLAATQEALRRGLYSQLPELFVFEDKTRFAVEAINLQFTATFYARLFAVGFSYELSKTNIRPDEADPAVQIRVQASKK